MTFLGKTVITEDVLVPIPTRGDVRKPDDLLNWVEKHLKDHST